MCLVGPQGLHVLKALLERGVVCRLRLLECVQILGMVAVRRIALEVGGLQSLLLSDMLIGRVAQHPSR